MLLALTVGAALVSAQAPPVDAQEIADEIAKQIRKSEAKGEKGRRGPLVLVLPFPVADELDAALATHAERFEVADRQGTLQFIREQKLPPREFTQDPVAAWLGRRFGAQLVVAGAISEKKDHVRFEVWLVKVSEGRKIAALDRKLPRSEETLALATPRRPAMPRPPRETDTTEDVDTVAQAGKNGVGFPKCLRCPNPPFAPEATGVRNYRGSVILRVVVTAEGTAKDIQLIQGAAFGLSERAIEIVRTWKFEPARDAQGNAVAVRTAVEISFAIM